MEERTEQILIYKISGYTEKQPEKCEKLITSTATAQQPVEQLNTVKWKDETPQPCRNHTSEAICSMTT